MVVHALRTLVIYALSPITIHSPGVTTTQFIKVASNAWGRALSSGKLSVWQRVRLGALTKRVPQGTTVNDFGKYRIPSTHQSQETNLIPIQSTGETLKKRLDMTGEMQDEFTRHRASLSGIKPSRTRIVPTEDGFWGASARVSKGSSGTVAGLVSMPPKSILEVPGLRKRVLAHELGHIRDFTIGPPARAKMDLKDRLLHYQLDKRAPGINYSHYAPAVIGNEARAQNNAWDMLNPGSKEKEARLANVIQHLRTNYGAQAPYPQGQKITGPIKTFLAGLPLKAQLFGIDGPRNLSKEVLPTVGSLLSRFRK